LLLLLTARLFTAALDLRRAEIVTEHTEIATVDSRRRVGRLQRQPHCRFGLVAIVSADAYETPAPDEQEKSDPPASSRLLRLPLRLSVPARPARSLLVRCERLSRAHGDARISRIPAALAAADLRR
jgi:hypothetical protein